MNNAAQKRYDSSHGSSSDLYAYHEDYANRLNLVGDNIGLGVEIHEEYDEMFMRSKHRIVGFETDWLQYSAVSLRPAKRSVKFKAGIVPVENYRMVLVTGAESVQPPRFVSKNKARLHLTELKPTTTNGQLLFGGTRNHNGSTEYPRQVDLRRKPRSVTPAVDIRRFSRPDEMEEIANEQQSIGALISEVLDGEKPAERPATKELKTSVAGHLSVIEDDKCANIVVTRERRGRSEITVLYKLPVNSYKRVALPIEERDVKIGDVVVTLTDTVTYARCQVLYNGGQKFKGGSKDVAVFPSELHPYPRQDGYFAAIGTRQVSRILDLDDANNGQTVDAMPPVNTTDRAMPAVLGHFNMSVEDLIEHPDFSIPNAAKKSMVEGVRTGGQYRFDACVSTQSASPICVVDHIPPRPGQNYHVLKYSSGEQQELNPHAQLDEEFLSGVVEAANGDHVGWLVPREPYLNWAEIEAKYPEAAPDIYRAFIDNVVVKSGYHWRGVGCLLPGDLIPNALRSKVTGWYYDLRKCESMYDGATEAIAYPLFLRSAYEWQIEVGGYTVDIAPDPNKVIVEEPVSKPKRRSRRLHRTHS